jgi:hypothetical protein
MSNPITRAAVCGALGLAADHCNVDVFKRLVAGGFLPTPLDAAYDSFDLSAVQAVVGTAATVKAAAGKISSEHRGGPKAVF